MSFPEWDSDPWEQKNLMLWRHDVDISMNRAFALAKIEYEFGIRATYFLRLRSNFYNILEDSQLILAREITSLNHNIGLHFEASESAFANNDIFKESLNKDKNLLENILDIEIKAFSFHDPNSFALKFDDSEYVGMTNAYSREIRRAFEYISDSRGYWRFKQLNEIIRNSITGNVHALTHPEWWQLKSMPPYERVKRSIDGRAKNVMKNYDRAIELQARENVGVKHHDYKDKV